MASRPALFSLLTLLAMHLCCVLSASRYPMRLGQRRLAKGDIPTPPNKADELLFKDFPSQSAKMMRRTAKEAKCYPPMGSTDNIKITRFEVQDQYSGTTGGVAFQTSGDVGMNQVCFYFKSQKGRGFRFEVDVYGYRNPTPTQQKLGGFQLPADEVDAEEDEDDDKKKKEEEEKKKAAEKKEAEKKEAEKKAADKKKKEEEEKKKKEEEEKKKKEEEEKKKKEEEEKKKAAEKKPPPPPTSITVSVNMHHH